MAMVVNPIQIQKFLEGMVYPASKEQIIQYAEQQGADEDIIGTLQRLPEEEYETPADVNEAIGKLE